MVESDRFENKYQLLVKKSRDNYILQKFDFKAKP